MRLPRDVNEEQGEAPVNREKAFELVKRAAAPRRRRLTGRSVSVRKNAPEHRNYQKFT
jgi:hypothetical protein